MERGTSSLVAFYLCLRVAAGELDGVLGLHTEEDVGLLYEDAADLVPHLWGGRASTSRYSFCPKFFL